MATEVHNPTVQTQPLGCARPAGAQILAEIDNVHIRQSFWGHIKAHVLICANVSMSSVLLPVS